MKTIIVVAVLLASLLAATSAHAGPADRHRTCRYNSVSHVNWTPWETRKTIACATDKWHVALTRAMYIAWRESRLEPTVVNSVGACGLYQFMPGWHPSLPNLAKLNGVRGAESCKNARTSALAFAHVVHDSGWGDWE